MQTLDAALGKTFTKPMLKTTRSSRRRAVGIGLGFFALALAFLGCSPPQTPETPPITKVHHELMGTFVDISVFGTPTPVAKAAIDSGFDAISDLQSWAHPNWPSSELHKLNAAAGEHPVALNEQMYAMLELAHRISQQSGGAFDVTFAGIGRLWNLKDSAAFSVPSEQALAAAVAKIDYRKLELNAEDLTAFLAEKGMRANLGGIAKGWSADLAMQALKKGGVTAAIVNAGGDMLLTGDKDGDAWRVGIRHPRKGPTDYLGVLLLKGDVAVATSGDYERYVMHDEMRYHHIFDPKTGKPARKAQSVTIVAPTAALADALATSVFVLGAEKGLAFLAEFYPACDAFVVDEKGGFHRSVNFDRHLEGPIKP
jgi:FAD:protein FMN transferase